jgi:hypothetical protein
MRFLCHSLRISPLVSRSSHISVSGIIVHNTVEGFSCICGVLFVPQQASHASDVCIYRYPWQL